MSSGQRSVLHASIIKNSSYVGCTLPILTKLKQCRKVLEFFVKIPGNVVGWIGGRRDLADMRVVGVQVIEAVVTMADTAAVAMTVAVVTAVVEAATTVIVTADILEVCHRAAGRLISLLFFTQSVLLAISN